MAGARHPGADGSPPANPPNVASDPRARRPLYRRRLSITIPTAALVLAAIALIAAVVRQSPSPTAVAPPSDHTSVVPSSNLDGRIGTSLIFLRSGSREDPTRVFISIDSDNGRRREVSLTGFPSSSIGPIIQRADHLAFSNNEPLDDSSNRLTNRAYSFPLSLEGRPRLLSPEPVSNLFASFAPDRIWLTRDDRGLPSPPDGRGTVWEVDFTGRITTPPQSYVLGRYPVAAVEGGLIREAKTGAYPGGLEFWEPTSGTVRPIASNGRLVDVHGSTVAWLGDGDGLHLTDARTGTDRVVRQPSEAVVFFGNGAFSPDGRRLAIHMVDAADVGGSPPALSRFATDETFTSSWVLVDVGAMTAQVVDGSRSEHGFAAGRHWSADSQWFLFSKLDQPTVFGPGPGPAPTATILAYRLGAPTAKPLLPVTVEEALVGVR